MVQAEAQDSDRKIVTPAQLVLASGSPYRRRQLGVLALPFDTASPDIDESARSGELPEPLAVRLAAAKARAIARQRQDSVIIGSDQVAVLDGQQLTKPASVAAARSQLARSSGRTVEFITALHIVDQVRDREHAAVDRTRVTLRSLSNEEIERYVAVDQPLDCAGAFKVESLGIALFSAIESRDPTALVGLPMIHTARLLRDCGFRVP